MSRGWWTISIWEIDLKKQINESNNRPIGRTMPSWPWQIAGVQTASDWWCSFGHEGPEHGWWRMAAIGRQNCCWLLVQHVFVEQVPFVFEFLLVVEQRISKILIVIKWWNNVKKYQQQNKMFMMKMQRNLVFMHDEKTTSTFKSECHSLQCPLVSMSMPRNRRIHCDDTAQRRAFLASVPESSGNDWMCFNFDF